MDFKKVVCFGGGTGLSTLLSGLKHNPWLELSALVNTFDSGGSSGELHDRFGILPPGDTLKCLLALSEYEKEARVMLLKRLRHNKYTGHTGGNVLLFGLERVYEDHVAAVEALGQLLSIQGQVIPISELNSSMCALYSNGEVYKSEVSVDVGIKEGKKVEKLFLEPPVEASEKALAAIRRTHAICIGPGSFYTSILPNFLPLGVKEAITESKAPIIFIANLLTEGRGMRDYDAKKYVAVLESYIGRSVDYIVLNKFIPSPEILDLYTQEHKYPIEMGEAVGDSRFIQADLWTDLKIARHNQARLATLVSSLIQRGTN